MNPQLTSVDLQVDGTLATPDGGCGRSDAKAQLLVEGQESSPCMLNVSAIPASFSASGVCPGVPTGRTRTLSLQWLEPGTSTLLAESVGRADLTAPAQSTVVISFSGLQTKTMAVPTEPIAEQLRFNVDRGGPDGGTTQVDSCSNYQEYCAGTLDEVAINTCP